MSRIFMETIPLTWVSLRKIPPSHQRESPLTTILHSHWHESSSQLICQGSKHGRNIQIRGKRFLNTWSFFFSFKKKKCFRKYWKKYYNNCLHNSKLMMSLTRFYQYQNIIPFIHWKKRKKDTNSNRRESVDSKVLTIQKPWQFFFFPRREEGFLACLVIYDSLDAKAQETNFFYSWVWQRAEV